MRVEGEVGPQGDIAEREVAVRSRARLGSPIVYFGVDAGVLGNTKLGCTTHFMESLTGWLAIFSGSLLDVWSLRTGPGVDASFLEVVAGPAGSVLLLTFFSNCFIESELYLLRRHFEGMSWLLSALLARLRMQILVLGPRIEITPSARSLNNKWDVRSPICKRRPRPDSPTSKMPHSHDVISMPDDYIKFRIGLDCRVEIAGRNAAGSDEVSRPEKVNSSNRWAVLTPFH